MTEEQMEGSLTVTAQNSVMTFDKALVWVVQAVEHLGVDHPTVQIWPGEDGFNVQVSGTPVRNIEVIVD